MCISIFWYTRSSNEPDLPTKKKEAGENARVFTALGDPSWACSFEATASEGQKTPHAVNAVRVIQQRLRADAPELVVVVGKTVAKKAATRNLIKRRVRAILHPFLETPMCSYKVIIGKGAATLSFAELRKELLEHVRPL